MSDSSREQEMTNEIQVIYVDDEPALLDLGIAFLPRLGNFSVTTASTALQALDLIASQAFDAIISDYQMPEMNGIEFLKQVRRSGNTIPFILFTGRGREEVVIQALNEGADFYIQKGGDPRSQFTELAHKIRQAVHHKQLESMVRDKEQREADILNFLPDATFAIDTSGVVIAWNRAMEQMAGIPAEKILGTGDFGYALPFYHERRPMLINLILHDDPAVREKYPDIRQEADRLSSEITLPHFQDQRSATFWFTASPLYNSRGDITGAIESIREITDFKRAEEALRLDEARLEALLTLNLMIGESEETLIHFALEEAVQLTQSRLGYIAYISDDNAMLTMQSWSESAMDACRVRERKHEYPLESTGLWGEPVRQRHPVITNDYQEENPQKRGLPPGHVSLDRHLGVPIFDGDRIVAVVGVGNKHEPYTASDIRQIELLISGMWTIIQRKKAEQTLRKSHEELQAAYEEIYATDAELRENLEKFSIQGRYLEEREALLHTMATNIPGVMFRCVVAPDGSTGFTYISERCMDILGIENDTDTFSEHLTENIIPEDRERFLTSIQEAITNRSLWRFEGRYHKPGCDTIWMKAISSPVIDGSVYIFDGIIFDDTAWKRLDEYNRILAHMLDHAPAAITIHDYEGNFLYANEETFTLHGYSRDEFLSLNLHDLDVPESAALISERMSSLRENSFTEFSVEHFRKNQTRIPLRVCVKPISWEGRNVQLSVATDLTEQRRFEQALHDANLKIRLLMSLTRHDIINHLMVMRGALFLAQDETDLGVLNDCISRAIQAGEKIGKVIEFTREYEMTGLSASGWVNVRTMVEWAGKEVSLGEIRLMNEIPGDIEIYSDAIITRVFASIIENAVRHGGTVTRIICSSLITGSRLTLICEDDGEGIPPEEKELIFENGYGKNTGFGLFLSRELLSVTGFCVQETGEHRSGARFEIQVPSDKFRILPAG